MNSERTTTRERGFTGRLPAPARPAALCVGPRSSFAFGSGHPARSGLRRLFTSLPFGWSVLILCLIGWLPLAAEAGEDISALEADFLKGEYSSVISAARQLLERGDSAERDTLLYLQGVSALKLRSLDAARLSLERLAREFPQSRWTLQGAVALGETLTAMGEYEKARELYQKLLADPKAKSFYPQVTLRLGQIQRSLGAWEEAKNSLQAVTQLSPESPEAAQAKEILNEDDFHFAVQVGAFGAKANALKLRAECQRRGYKTEVSETLLEGRRFYRVRVGSFARREEAQKQADQLRAEGFPSRVVP